MRTSFDFTPFRRSTVGFDQLFDLLERGPAGQANESFPPFDIEQKSDDHYVITLAVAGFQAGDIDITAQQNQLVISGNRKAAEDGQYIHRGIASRAFERRFALGDFVKVRGADLRDGLLSVTLAREIPEEMKPHRIAINSNEMTLIEGEEKPSGEGANENGREAKAA